MKLSAAFEASIALSFGDVSDAYQFFPSTLGISDNPDYRANLQHCRITDIDYKRNHAGVSDHVLSFEDQLVVLDDKKTVDIEILAAQPFGQTDERVCIDVPVRGPGLLQVG